MDTTLQDPIVGRLLEDRYLVVERIARGGMATVYHALDQRLDRDVALKVLHSHLAGDEAFATRFVREARSAARLSHPGVVGVFDQGRDGELLFLAMEYLPGRTLREVLVERGALTPKEALRVMDPVLDALAAAHRAGIVHRDVKPENVILTDDGRVKVADFGLARASSSNATSGVLLGTVAYLAPETVLHGTADARSDVYAAGVMLFELLTGRQPFLGDVPAQVAYRHVHEDVPAPSTVAPSVPRALDEIVLAATARTPDERPVDAAALLTQLRGARSRLAPGELDARADVSALGAAAGAGAVGSEVLGDPYPDLSATQAVAGMAAAPANRTQALPALAGDPTLLGGPAPTGRRRRLVPSALPVNEDAARLDDADYARLAEERRRRGMLVMGAVIAAAVLMVIGAYVFLAGPLARVVVPATATLSQQEAEERLADADLSAQIREKHDDEIKKGIVIGSDPAAGDTVRKNGTVVLIVSSGPELVEIPSVAGSTINNAKDVLEGQGFRIGKIEQEYSDDFADGMVIGTTPAEGTEHARGSSVGLVVSRGEQPITVPDVRGRPQQEAEQILRDNGFSPVVAADQEANPQVPAGSVASQNPEPNSQAQRNSEVEIVISSGGDMARVPNVVGRRAEDAVEELQREGFQVQINGDNEGRVTWQNPFPGSEAPRGSTVTINTSGWFG